MNRICGRKKERKSHLYLEQFRIIFFKIFGIYDFFPKPRISVRKIDIRLKDISIYIRMNFKRDSCESKSSFQTLYSVQMEFMKIFKLVVGVKVVEFVENPGSCDK